VPKDKGENVESALRASLSRLPGSAAATLFGALSLERGESPFSADAAARRMADPAWARAAVRGLSARARSALRILIRVNRDVSPADLDALARAVPLEEPTRRAPSEELLANGLAVVSVERQSQRMEDRRLSAVNPLRERLAILLQEDAPGAPPLPSTEEDAFKLRRFELQMAVLYALVEQTRPRVTRFLELHRVDERAIVDQLTTLFGSADEVSRRLEQVIRSDAFTSEEDRLRLDLAQLRDGRSQLSLFLHQRMAERRHSTIFRVLFGLLVSNPGWVRETALLEAGGVAALSSPPFRDSLRRIREELTHLTRLPGVEIQRTEAHAWWRLTSSARDAVESAGAGTGGPRNLLVQPNLQIVVSPGTGFVVVAQLGRLARLVSADQVAVFTIDEALVRRSAAEGTTASDFLALLEKEASLGVPQTVARALADWARPRGTARVTSGIVVQTDVPPEEVRRILGSRFSVTRLSDGWLQVSGSTALPISLALRKAGIMVHGFGDESGPVGDRGSGERKYEDDEDEEIDRGMTAFAPSAGVDVPAHEPAGDVADLARSFREEARRMLRVRNADG
jgi:hypothetical protein